MQGKADLKIKKLHRKPLPNCSRIQGAECEQDCMACGGSMWKYVLQGSGKQNVPVRCPYPPWRNVFLTNNCLRGISFLIDNAPAHTPALVDDMDAGYHLTDYNHSVSITRYLFCSPPIRKYYATSKIFMQRQNTSGIWLSLNRWPCSERVLGEICQTSNLIDKTWTFNSAW